MLILPLAVCPARAGPIGAELGQLLKLPLQVLLDLGLLLGQPFQLVGALLGVGIALGFPRFLEVLSLLRAGLRQLGLGVLQLLDQS